VQVLLEEEEYGADDAKKKKKQTLQAYALWRTLSEDVTELTGYPIPFLIERHKEMTALKNNADAASSSALHPEQPSLYETLPYLDEFEFTPSGGLAGRVSGVAGVADGTVIETTPLGNVHQTVPKGFVRTKDGTLYELGRPFAADIAVATGASASSAVTAASLRSASETAGSMASQAARELASLPSKRRSSSSSLQPPQVVDPELVQLGALTAMVVAGAVAFETLSHHLTVNVFWV